MTTSTRTGSALARAAGWGLAGAVVWLLAAAELGAAELLFAALAGAVTAILAVRLDAHGLAWLGGARPPLRLGADVPKGVVRDLRLVLAALGRTLAHDTLDPTALGGVVERVRFDPGAADAPSEARRALVLGLTSLAPNTIALGVDAEHGGALLVHRLVDAREARPKGGPAWPL